MKKYNLETYELKEGSHKGREAGMCAMEMVAYLAHEPHSDHPQCACPALTNFVMKLNDRFSLIERQLLKPFLPKLIGTRDTQTLNRSKFLAHAAITVFAAHAMESVGLHEHATKLREVKDLVEGEKVARAACAAVNAANATDAADAANAAYYAAANAANAAYYVADAANVAYNAAANAANTAAYAANAASTTRRQEIVNIAIQTLKEVLEKFPAEGKENEK